MGKSVSVEPRLGCSDGKAIAAGCERGSPERLSGIKTGFADLNPPPISNWLPGRGVPLPSSSGSQRRKQIVLQVNMSSLEHEIEGRLKLSRQFIHPSIHPSILLRLSGVGSRGQQPEQGNPDFPLPGHFGQLLRGDPEAFPGQPGHIVPPAGPGSSSGPSPGGTSPEHLPREATRRHPEQMPEPPQLAPLHVEEQRLYSEPLPDGRASHPISKGEPRHPAEETHFGRLYPRSRSFGHYPKLVTIDEGFTSSPANDREMGQQLSQKEEPESIKHSSCSGMQHFPTEAGISVNAVPGPGRRFTVQLILNECIGRNIEQLVYRGSVSSAALNSSLEFGAED
ncbi:unnamed protein product [Menidia menidia]|uniref:(Atlantic silverside) hypothetical protein n=1 Tax=Menidia menidia TaxID=238744 RepID=A0A8S4BCW0_9TELE|nr:unnamed protein product [Menidia menidia]